jgi:hypothetical protein
VAIGKRVVLKIASRVVLMKNLQNSTLLASSPNFFFIVAYCKVVRGGFFKGECSEVSFRKTFLPDFCSSALPHFFSNSFVKGENLS